VRKKKNGKQQQKTLLSTNDQEKEKQEKMIGLTKDQMDWAIWVILFSGKPKDWLALMEKFLAKERQKGLKDIYLRDPTKIIPMATELEALDATKAADMILIHLEKSNEDAYAEWIMSIDTTTTAVMVAFHIVASTKMTDYLDGNAPIAWTWLKTKYQLDTGTELSRSTKEFYSMDMKEGQDPDVVITKLEYNQYRMEELGSKISDKQLKIHILNYLPMEYDVSVNLLRRRNTTITLEELWVDLQYEYDRLKSRKNDSGSNNNHNNRNSNEEHALFVGGKFNGECHHCGQYGHRIGACWFKDPSKKQNGSGGRGGGQQQNSASGRGGNNQGGCGGQGGRGGGRFSGTCHYCQKVGHRINDCQKKKRDEGGKTAATATSQQNNNNITVVLGIIIPIIIIEAILVRRWQKWCASRLIRGVFDEDELPSDEFEDLLEQEYKLLTQDEASDNKEEEALGEESSDTDEDIDLETFLKMGFTK
jgi:uncharacterized membrane protein YgcG